MVGSLGRFEQSWLGMSRGRGNPWGLGVRVYKGKGEGLDFQTPDPSRHP